MSVPISIIDTGLVTSVGLTSEAACAAMRAGLSNPTETGFRDSTGEEIVAHQVPLRQPWRGVGRLAKMAAAAAAESLATVPQGEWGCIPLLLCVAEPERPGRLADLDEQLFATICGELNTHFHWRSEVIARGKVSTNFAFLRARGLLSDEEIPFVLIVAADSLVTWPTLGMLERQRRLLMPGNSDGFLVGEGAGALLIGRPGPTTQLLCTGLGFAMESAHIHSGEPLRGDGLTSAIKEALADASCEIHDLDYRITDLSGEQYYFKESALALLRTLRVRKEEFDIWHPAASIGECGAAVGPVVFALAGAASRKGYAPGGASVLCHFANDAGERAAAVLQFRSR